MVVLHIYLVVTTGLLALAGVLHLVPRLGGPGRALAAHLIRAPLLDWVVFIFTVLPMLGGLAWGHWAAGGGWMTLACFGGAVAGQATTLIVWSRLHELAHPEARRGPRIVTTLNRRFGPVRNALAVWWTGLAAPVFSLVRLAEVLVYPPLTWLVALPKYRSSEWVNVSRQKFDGLVGSDRIWCLYCDWMTGVWSLGSEMLRNVESFWCPIRFRSDLKCDHCAVDFPDVAGGWVPADATMADVVAVVEAKYPGPDGTNAWFGHPVRLTAEGRPLDPDG